MGIYSIKIRNFKSIRETDDILIKPLNVLIGPNGAGKSNFISFFKFLHRLYENKLQLHISQHGRADNFLYFGQKNSDFLSGKIVFDNEWKNEYSFTMIPDASGNLIFADEFSNYTRQGFDSNTQQLSTGGNTESHLKNASNGQMESLKNHFAGFKIFHFHDTGFNSKIKQPCATQDYSSLREDGGNLAAFLYCL